MIVVNPSNGFDPTKDVNALEASSFKPETNKTKEGSVTEQKTEETFKKTIAENEPNDMRECCIQLIMEQKGVTREVAEAEYDFFS